MRLQELVTTLGLMVGGIQVNGRTTSCMALAFTPGKMVVSRTVNISKIKSMVKGLTHGQTRDNIRASGLMACSMEKASSSLLMVCREGESGIKDSELSGFRHQRILIRN